MTAPARHDILALLMRAASGVTSAKPHMVVPGVGGPSPYHPATDLQGPDPTAALISRGVCCFPGLGQAPALGAAPSVGRTYAAWVWLPCPGVRAAATVRNRPPMQRKAPAAVWRSKGGKAEPRHPERWQKCWWSVTRKRDPYRGHEAQGHTWADERPGRLTAPGSGLHDGWRGLF